MTERQLALAKQKEERQQAKREKELARSADMYSFEREYAQAGLIAGIDEVGRGPLAGPVLTCSVILPSDHMILYLNDSKKLSEKKRNELYDIILSEAISCGIGMEQPETIDDINILQATFKAMRTAVGKLDPAPDLLLVDAVHIPDLSVKQISIIKGDAKSASIAAASIIAKVTRDRMMVEYDALYPEYGFARNKGYGTAEHIEALKKYGPCPIHRKSFIGNFVKV